MDADSVPDPDADHPARNPARELVQQLPLFHCVGNPVHLPVFEFLDVHEPVRAGPRLHPEDSNSILSQKYGFEIDESFIKIPRN